MSTRRGAVGIIVVLLAWELAVRIFNPSAVIIVAPSAIVEAFVDLAQKGILWNDFAISMVQFSMGFLVAAVVGIPLGLIMGMNLRVRDYGDPLLTTLYTTPSVALAPLFIIWLGLGNTSHIAIIALVAFFPIIINTIDGVRQVEKDLTEVGLAFRANGRERFSKIDLPGSLPYIFTGLRLGLARGLVGIVVADLFGAQGGLGFLLLNSAQLFQTANVFVAVVVLAGLGVLFTVGLRFLEKRLMPWQGQ